MQVCGKCGCEGFRLSERNLCDGCEEHVSFNERVSGTDRSKE